MPASEFTILPPLAFIADCLKEARHAKKRIFLQAMDIEEGELANHFLSIVDKGTTDHLDTRVHVDHYSFMVTDGVFNYLPLLSKNQRLYRTKRLEKRKRYFQTLRQQGVKVTYTNTPSLVSKLFPMFGRNHIKLAIIDDVAYLGGINFHDANFKSNDCMVKLTNHNIVQHLVTLFEDIENETLRHDKKIHCTDDTYLLVDSGKVGTSIILNEATRLVREAKKSVTVITPIIPDSNLLSALTDMKRAGITIKVAVPVIEKMKGIYIFLDNFNQYMLSLKTKNLEISYKDKPIHAKIMVIDDEKVLLGSHNLTNRGVLMGTEELAIVSTDQHFVKQAQSFITHVHAR